MSDAKKIPDIRNVIAFVGGAAAALILPKALKSKPARKAAVYAVAKGMRLQNDACGAFEEIREDARDIYHEAKEQAENKAQGEGAKDGIQSV
jgi:hypothetical protein